MNASREEGEGAELRLRDAGPQTAEEVAEGRRGVRRLIVLVAAFWAVVIVVGRLALG